MTTNPGKTHFADDDTIAYIAKLEEERDRLLESYDRTADRHVRELSAANDRIKELVQTHANNALLREARIDQLTKALNVFEEVLEGLKLKVDPKYGWPIIEDAIAKINEIKGVE